MKIGILTFHNADNYGSVLQAYALKNFVESLEDVTECSIVNFMPPNQEKLYAVYLKNNSLKNVIKNLRAFCFRKLLKNRKESFKKFRQSRLKINDAASEFKSVEERRLSDFDAMIVGSDQIWNPRSNDFSLFYFVPEFNGKKIAYAPSFGNGTINDFEKDSIRETVGNALRAFDYVSARETSGVSIIDQLSGKKAITVMDPTLLIGDKWNEVASDYEKDEKYIFFYAIDYNPEAIEMVKKTSKKTGLPVKVIFSSNRVYRTLGKGFDWVKATSPEDFLGLIKNAQLVLSSSFHGTAFSVIFRKKFYALEAHRNGAIYKDQRIHNLLSKIDLEDRIITSSDIDNMAQNDFLKDIKYNNSLIEAVIGESQKYLIDAIKE